MPKSKIDSAPLEAPQALLELLKHMSKIDEFSYLGGESDGALLKEESNGIDPDQTSVEIEFDEGAPRDFFWDHNALIKNIIGAIEDNQALEDYFDFENSERILTFQEPSDGEGYSTCSLWWSHPEKNWLITLQGSMGGYNDENYDVSGSLSVDVNLPKEKLSEMLATETKRWSTNLVQGFANQVEAFVKNQPPALKVNSMNILEEDMRASSVFQPALAHKQKQEIHQQLGSDKKKSRTSSPKM